MKKYFHRNHGKVGKKTNVWFIPAVTIDCDPPYVKGKIDSCWTNVTGIDPCNKKQSENAIGVKLLPLNK